MRRLERFSDIGLPGVLLGHRAISLKHQLNGLQEVVPRFIESTSLGVCSRQFLDVPDVSLGYLPEDGRQCDVHGRKDSVQDAG